MSLHGLLPGGVLLTLCSGLAGCTGNIEEFAPPRAGTQGEPVAGKPGDDGRPPVGVVTADLCAQPTSNVLRSPLRRLTRREYNNTVRDLLGDTTEPAFALPSEELGNGFGNDADALAVSSLLAEQLSSVAGGIAQRATDTSNALNVLLPCAKGISPANEAACLRTFVNDFAPRAYRRPLESGEADELVALGMLNRPDQSFALSVSAVIEAVLQGPEFLYRPELGIADERDPQRKRPSAHEMATRLSYLFWGTMPDAALLAAAEAGRLADAEGVLAQAQLMVEDPRTRKTIAHFFDNLLPISGLGDLERDKEQFPSFSPSIGKLMHEETQRMLEHALFDGEGSWPAALTAPYTFVNETLAKFYGMSGVTGSTFQKVDLDPAQRLGVLTLGGVMAGSTHSNSTNPVSRGAFIAQKLLCRTIALPTGDILDQIKPPDPYSGKTARERYSAHRSDPVCATCHVNMDPFGLALENYDPVGLFRTTENGVTIDVLNELPGGAGVVDGPLELARNLAQSEDAQACFATTMLAFAYGITPRTGDGCTKQGIVSNFASSGHNVKQLLLDLTQTESFLYLSP